MDDDDKIILFPRSVQNGQAERDNYAAHRKQLIDELRNRHELSAIKKTGEGHQGKNFDSELFREKKSASQVLSRRYLLSLLDRKFGGRSPVEAKPKDAIINCFFAVMFLLNALPTVTHLVQIRTSKLSLKN